MKAAITASGSTLDASIDPRFGRCAFFLIVDTDTMEFDAVENPNLALGQGAGIQSAKLVAEKGVKFVLTGNCGPNAHQTLSAAGIGVVLGNSGTVRDAVERLKAGQFQTAGEPNVAGHSGTVGASVPGGNPSTPSQQSPMPGGGMGMGRGRGGGGRGMGRGMGVGMGGGGRGQGMGRGRGQGQGKGRGQGAGGA